MQLYSEHVNEKQAEPKSWDGNAGKRERGGDMVKERVLVNRRQHAGADADDRRDDDADERQPKRVTESLLNLRRYRHA